MKINYLDLFAGIGGFSLGLLQAGFEFNWHGFSEIDKHAKKIYQKHFLLAEDLGDVRTIKLGTERRVDLITFGFPCTDLSIAGKRKGLEGNRSGLFYEAIRIIQDTQPRYFIFENVMGLLSKSPSRNIIEKREWFLRILHAISDIGYDGQWQNLNTNWVLPQNRERIYFVGYPRRQRRPEIFPITESDVPSGKANGRETPKTRTLCVGQRNFRRAGESLIVVKNKDQFEERKIINAIDANYFKGADCHQQRSLIKVGDLYDDSSQGGRIYDSAGLSAQLTAQGGGLGAKTGLYQTTYGIRRLTPLECERLQGFPDGWCEGISETQKYKCLGNAVSVPIVKLVAKKLKEKP